MKLREKRRNIAKEELKLEEVETQKKGIKKEIKKGIYSDA